jgi:hypothetical protein
LIHAADAARMLARSTRSVHMLAAAGYLQRITMPGRKRAGGFREADVLALMQSPATRVATNCTPSNDSTETGGAA